MEDRSHTEFELQTFDPGNFFRYSVDGVELKEAGIRLLCDYYRYKNGANITLIHDAEGDHFEKFLELQPDILKRIKESDKDYREAFLLGATGHVRLIYLLKEGNNIGYVIADSTGESRFEAIQIKDRLNILSEFVLEGRQFDDISCYADGVKMGADGTRKKPGTDEYEFPGLLRYFMENAIDEKNPKFVKFKEKYKITFLPDFLLKTAQLESFVKTHHKEPDPIIHTRSTGEQETLQQHRARYKDKNDYSNFLFQKGFKMADIILIQFYLDQLLKQPDKMTDKEIKTFIKEAKKEIQGLDPPDKIKCVEKLCKPYVKNMKKPGFKSKT